MMTAELIADMTARIERDFDPLRIILFGSHVRMNDTEACRRNAPLKKLSLRRAA